MSLVDRLWVESSFFCCICGKQEFVSLDNKNDDEIFRIFGPAQCGNNPAPLLDKFFGRCCNNCNKYVVQTRNLLMVAAVSGDKKERIEGFLNAFSQHGITTAVVQRELKRFSPVDVYAGAFWQRSDKNDFSKVLGHLEYYCCICGKKNYGYGFDPFPVKHNLYGGCCQSCSEDFVRNKSCCFKCRAEGDNITLKTCSRCHSAKYCSKECQKLDWDCHKKECCMNLNERGKAAGTCHHDSSKSKNRSDEDTINISSKKSAAKDDDDDVEEVYTDFKGRNAHSDDVNIMEDNKLEKEHLLLQKEVQKLALALEKKDAKLSKVKEKHMDLLLENEGLKTIIKQEDATKLSPEELLSCQVCAEEYTYHVDSSEGFNRNLPVQSQVCEHVICYGCVCRMQQALLETRNVVKWIKCPMCNTKHAFNAEKPIISRVNVEWIRSQKKREDSSSNNAITTGTPKNDTPDNTAIGSNDAHQYL